MGRGVIHQRRHREIEKRWFVRLVTEARLTSDDRYHRFGHGVSKRKIVGIVLVGGTFVFCRKAKMTKRHYVCRCNTLFHDSKRGKAANPKVLLFVCHVSSMEAQNE